MRGKEEWGTVIANDYHLDLAKAELEKSRRILADLETILAALPHSIAVQVKAQRQSAVVRRIQELEAEIQQYARAQRSVLLAAPRV